MDIFENLPEIARNKVLLFLVAKDLAHLSLSSKSWREFSNQDKFWHRICIINDLVKFEYLFEKQHHECVPHSSSPNNISPIFKLPGF